ncbi:MAG: hypothetical protein JXR76_22770 [Deltaproteobacteria bacterium]|nr:hypothetical protein [Deltaproteobacteria bacterium]
MFHQTSSKKTPYSQQPMSTLMHLETFLTEDTTDAFYTGFSGRIEDGGIFIKTSEQIEKYTPVQLAIHFPDGHTIKPRGTVEWVRSGNPAACDVSPGVGISFVDLQRLEVELIENWLTFNPPTFLENVEMVSLQTTQTVPNDNIERDSVPLNLGPGCDLDSEQLFISGLARDVSHYLSERPLSYLRARIDGENRRLSQRLAPVWTLRILAYDNDDSFQGAFEGHDSSHRLFVRTNTPAAIGSVIRMKLICRDGAQIGCKGEVRWVRKPNPLLSQLHTSAGMGVVLVDVKEASWRTINPNNEKLVHCEFARVSPAV